MIPARSGSASSDAASQTANRRGVYIFSPIKLRSYWTDVHHIFTQCSQIIANELLKSELRYFTSFRNANATNEGESADFAYFNPKIGWQLPWQHPLSDRKKRIKSVIYDQILTIW